MQVFTGSEASPCPFCGGKDITADTSDIGWIRSVICSLCHASGPGISVPREAEVTREQWNQQMLDAWNHRKPSTYFQKAFFS